MSGIIHICDGKACENNPYVSCKFGPRINIDRCSHTTDPSHAKFGPCEDPENHPERFEKLDCDSFCLYWEVIKENGS